ncbi:hypothetical protein Ahia01_000613400 [Argonauta hians]
MMAREEGTRNTERIREVAIDNRNDELVEIELRPGAGGDDNHRGDDDVNDVNDDDDAHLVPLIEDSQSDDEGGELLIGDWCRIFSSTLAVTICFMCSLMHVLAILKYFPVTWPEYMCVFLDFIIIINSLIIFYILNPWTGNGFILTKQNFKLCACCAVFQLFSAIIVFGVHNEDIVKLVIVCIGTLACLLFVPFALNNYVGESETD